MPKNDDDAIMPRPPNDIEDPFLEAVTALARSAIEYGSLKDVIHDAARNHDFGHSELEQQHCDLLKDTRTIALKKMSEKARECNGILYDAKHTTHRMVCEALHSSKIVQANLANRGDPKTKNIRPEQEDRWMEESISNAIYCLLHTCMEKSFLPSCA